MQVSANLARLLLAGATQVVATFETYAWRTIAVSYCFFEYIPGSVGEGMVTQRAEHVNMSCCKN